MSSADSKKEKIWAEAKKRYSLSNEVIQMAKKLGLNPKKLVLGVFALKASF